MRIALAWAPFWLLWVLLCLSYPGATFGSAALAATAAVGTAALLALAAWRFTGRYGWPEELGLGFYGIHLLMASAFAMVWLVVLLGAESIRMDHGLWETAVAWKRVLGWYFVLGVSLYGLVTFFSYTVRTGARLREQERLATEARLASLRNQLNPHFLFNSLHSLSVLVRRDQAAAQVAIEQLGDILRYTLSESEADEVPLSEEWRFTKAYLALEQIRFGDRLVVEDQFAPSTMSCLVPSFTLQILTENAVRHGIGPRTSGGTVQLRSQLDGERLVLQVVDTGVGVSSSPTNGGNGGSRGGRGLKLLQERLTTLYGTAGQLEIRSTPNGGFTASVLLPARQA